MRSGETIAQHAINDLRDVRNISVFSQNAISETKENVHSHDCPRMGLINRAGNFTPLFSSFQALEYTVDSCAVMRLPSVGCDKFSLIEGERGQQGTLSPV